MKKLLLTLSIVFLFAACNNTDMENTLQKEIDDSFNADNPFLGTWKSTDGSMTVSFYDDYWGIMDIYNSFRYTYNKEVLMLHDKLFYETNHEDGNAILKFPYDFSSKHTFCFLDKEIKKIDVLPQKR